MKGSDIMIVCSKRVFLNILTQLMDAQTLINANYCLGDQTTPNGGTTTIDMGYHYNEDGQLMMDSAPQVKSAFVKTYNINYGNDSLNPQCYISQTATSVSNKSVEELFTEHLLSDETLAATHSFIYAPGLKGNGLRILIYRQEESLPFVPIICDYLSTLFGEDITFLDPMYRRELMHLRSQYVGNKEKAKETIEFVQNYKTYAMIRDTVWNIENGLGGFENLEQTLGAFSFEQLFKIYQMMFPNNPLPAGRYSQEQLMHIIMSMTRDKVVPRRSLTNLSVTDIFDGISDEELMAIHEYGSPM